MSKSYAQLLGKKFGGKWSYRYPCYWYCDDGKRYIARTSSGVDEWDNPLGPPDYIMYTEGEPSKKINGFAGSVNAGWDELCECPRGVCEHRAGAWCRINCSTVNKGVGHE